MRTAECATCMDLIVAEKAVCDGSGVIAITDYPKSRVVVCPNWPLDQDEPLAYWEALAAIDDDRMPLTMQQRMRHNVMAEVKGRASAEATLGQAKDARYFLIALILAAVVAGCWWFR